MSVILILNYYSNQKISQLKMILIATIGALIVGFLWEAYEVLARDTFLADGVSYWRDTGSDIIMDICGGFFASIYSYKILSKNG